LLRGPVAIMFPTDMNDFIYKVCPLADWQAAQSTGIYTGSCDDRRDGFIHFSTADQLAGTLAKHFAGQENLVLLAVEAGALGDRLKWETSRGGKLFPHLYGKLKTSQAAKPVRILLVNGTHKLPDGIAQT
jgi:uncharacterized protein (DUF952 family)